MTASVPQMMREVLGNVSELTIPFVLSFAGIILHFRLLNPTDMSFGFGMALYLACDCSRCVCARGRPQLEDRGESTASELGCSVLLGKIVVRTVQHLVRYAPKT